MGAAAIIFIQEKWRQAIWIGIIPERCASLF